MALDAATLALVADELNKTLLDAKIDKIFEPTRDEVVLTLRTRTDTFRLLLSARSGSARVCLTKETFENPLTPPGFCMLLRKHLTGGRLIALRREPGDRIVYFDFRCTNEMGDLVTNTLAAELMGRYSNLVLVQNGRIIDALKRVDFEDSEVRQLLPGLPYTLPPKPARPDFLATDAADLVAAACQKDLPVAAALGKTVSGVGPKAGLAILSVMTPERIALAAAGGDHKAFTAAPGVGPKLAQRIVLELKDKMKGFGAAGVDASALGAVAAPASSAGQAAAALVSLGYTGAEAAQALAGLDPALPVQELIRLALQGIGKRR